MKGILLLGTDEVIESRARRYKVALQRGDSPGLPFAKTLIMAPGTRAPWELLPAAWGLLEKWDAAVPLWRYDTTAEGAGTAAEREATRTVARDLRVLLHFHELLFVRKNEAGEALIAAWVEECSGGGPSALPPALPPVAGQGDKRLAFLRALYRVKPRLCVLPTSWLAETLGQAARGQPAIHRVQLALPQVRAPQVRSPNTGRPLVTVELEPGHLVKCHKGDEGKVLEQFRRQLEVKRGHRK